MCALALLSWARPARADQPPAEGRGFVAVAAVAGAEHVAGAWDSGFGGEVGVGHLAEADGSGTSWALSVGALAFSTRTGGRGWAEVAWGRRIGGEVLVGLGVGPAVELDRQRKPRLGAEATLWAFTVVVPYVRVGTLEHEGVFADFGLRIAFPAILW